MNTRVKHYTYMIVFVTAEAGLIPNRIRRAMQWNPTINRITPKCVLWGLHDGTYAHGQK